MYLIQIFATWSQGRFSPAAEAVELQKYNTTPLGCTIMRNAEQRVKGENFTASMLLLRKSLGSE